MVKKNFLNIAIAIIIIGIFFRLYNLNTEGYWWDEMLGFWTANPNISYLETYNRHITNDYTSIAYHLLLKLYYFIFGYSPEAGRYFTMLLGVTCIPLMGVLMNHLYNNNLSTLCAMFLTSFNIFLIEYSQENRVYILIFLTSIINLIYFFRIIFSKGNLNYNYIFYLFFSVISLILTPFFFIIIGAQIFYTILQTLIFKENNKIFILSILSIVIYGSLFFNNLSSIISSSSMIDKGVGYSTFEPNIRFLKNLFFLSFLDQK